MNHLIEVLTGANTDKIRRWGHEKLSTYGIGQELERAQWSAIGRELIRLGLIAQTTDKFPVIQLTQDGHDALRQRTTLQLTTLLTTPIAKPVTKTAKVARDAAEIPFDEALFERLRQRRKQLADERAVPAYIVFSDMSLRQMAHHYPCTAGEFSRISGVGEKKLREFGEIFLAEISQHLHANARMVFEQRMLSDE